MYCSRYNKPTNEYIGSLRLLDIETFGFISDYPLHQYEFSMCLISCSFSNDNNAYYCVGTGFVDQNGDKLDKGRVLVLLVEDGKLKLVAEKEISSNIPSLNAFQGKLLASVLDKIYLYEWKVYHDGTCGLQLKNVCGGLFTCRFVESRDKTVALGGHDVTLALLILEDEKGSFKQLGCLQANSCTAIKILDNDTYLASDSASTPF